MAEIYFWKTSPYLKSGADAFVISSWSFVFSISKARTYFQHWTTFIYLYVLTQSSSNAPNIYNSHLSLFPILHETI